jgi:hypothetical protein
MLGIVFFDASNRHGHLVHQPLFLKWRQTPKPSERPVPVPGLQKLRLQPFMLGALRNYHAFFIACHHQAVFFYRNRKAYDTAYRKQGKTGHHAPVENDNDKVADWRTKSKYYFCLFFASSCQNCSALGRGRE